MRPSQAHTPSQESMVLEQNCKSYCKKYHLAVMITASSPSVSKWDRPRSIAEVVGYGRPITSNRKKQLTKLFILSQETLRSVGKNKSYKKNTIAAEWNYKNLTKTGSGPSTWLEWRRTQYYNRWRARNAESRRR
jgi:hypothetical protein